MNAPTPIRAHAWQRDALDWYVEPAWCVEQLLDCEQFSGTTWDPACGLGTIPQALDRQGIPSCASDLLVREECRVPARQGDFLTEYAHGSVSNIVTNPPFRHAVEFAKRAIELTTHKVAILQRQNFLGSQGRWRELFEPHPPARVWIMCERPSMLPGPMVVAGVKASGGTEDYCWIVWDAAHRGPSELRWIPPRAKSRAA